MRVVSNEALQFAAPDSIRDNILQSVERSERLGNEVLMYWGQEECEFVTRLFDYGRPNPHIPEVPAPMMRDYKWPGIYKPFNHQRDTAAFLSLRPRAFCFNEAGTGKTSAAIWAADYLMNTKRIRRALIVCPISIMYSAWQADIFKTAMHRTANVAYGPPEKRKKILNAKYDFTIINYDGVNSMREEIERGDFDLIIIDEANGYKNTSTKRWKTMAAILKPSTWLWMMTGTPASQSPVDAFGLARLISPHRLPKFVTAWKDKVMIPVSRFTWRPKPTAKQDVFFVLQPAIRFTKSECLDLPEVVYQTRDIPMTPQVARYYKQLKGQMLIEAAGQSVSAVNAAVSVNKLLQLSGGAVYTDEKEILEFDIAPRLAALEETLDETSNKVVVFVPFSHTITVVREHLQNKGFSCEVIDGSVSAGRRATIINLFQTTPDPHVLVIQPQAASHGVTLTAADTVVFWSPVVSVETYLQCIARIDRVGQKNRMTVVHLQGSDVERKVYTMLQRKVDSHQEIVDLYREELGL